MATLQKYSVVESGNVGLGQAGSIFVAGTGGVTCNNGVFVAITFLEDTVFASGVGGLSAETEQMWPDDAGTGTDIADSGGAVIDGETFPKGVTIYGRWTQFQLASGLVIAYRG
tara:strand:- start:461 stop:799 length:339 start_codon:yes stop_codon:yes gene_type:complete